MARGIRNISPGDLEHYLAGVSYPASKDDLISAARRNEAPDEIVEAIWRLPKSKFRGPQEVQKAYGDIV